MMNDQPTSHSQLRRSDEEPPPIGGTWRRLYASVLIILALLVAIFYAFTRAFA